MFYYFKFVLQLLIFIFIVSCSTNQHPTSAKKLDSKKVSDSKDSNNVVIVKSKNTKHSSNSDDKVIFEGKNNILEIDYDSSYYNNKQSHDVTIVKGDQNNIKLVQKNVFDMSEDSNDTTIIDGDEKKVEYGAVNTNDFSKNSSEKETISTTRETFNMKDDYQDFISDTNLVFVEKLQNMVKISDAYNYYMNQAQKGDVESYYQLALFYHNGIGTKRNVKKAMEYYEVAARKNNIPSQYVLGYLYEYGYYGVTEINIEKAKYYFTLAAKNGDDDARQELEKLIK